MGSASESSDERRRDADDLGADVTEAATVGPDESRATAPGPSPRHPASKRLERLLAGEGESQALGRYIVLGTLGRGGMGTVLRAFDPKLDRRVAIKVLHRELNAEQTQRLLREAQALARLSHPNVVQVYEVDEVDGLSFVVMELVTGSNLADWLASDPRPGWRRCVEVLAQVGDGLAAAHAQGLVHRDFKPGNAIVDEQGRARVLDFGLAREADAEDFEATHVEDAELRSIDKVLSAPLTRTGAMVGTPAYMSLEQMYGMQVDARSDQFSFCVTLYEAVYGERPFDGPSIAEMMGAMVEQRIRPAPAGTRVPGALRRLLLRGLAREPEDRWPSMEALLVELRRLLAPRRRRWAGLAVGVGLAALGVGLGLQAQVGRRCSGARAQLDGIWDEARRAEVEAVMLGTERSYAAETWTRVSAKLDEYAEAWVAAHTEACTATAVRQEQSEEEMSLRMSCLRERRRSLDATVAVLARADESVVSNAVVMVGGLPGLERCEDVDQLMARHRAAPPPQDPTMAGQVERLRESLARGRAELRAGHFERAFELVDSVVDEAQTLGYPPLLIEATVVRGELHDERGHFEAAERDLMRAHLQAVEFGQDDLVLGSAQTLAFVVGYRQARPEGHTWAELALALARRRGDELDVAESINRRGMLALVERRYKAAEEDFRWVLDVHSRTLDEDHDKVINSINNMGAALYGQGRHEEAASLFRQALELRRHLLGDEHPRVAVNRNNLASVLMRLGRYDEALTEYRSALELRQRALGPEHPYVAASLGNLAALLYVLERYEESEQLYRRSLELRERLLRPDHPEIATALNNLADVVFKRERLDEAEQLYRRALALGERSSVPDSSAIGDACAGLAFILIQRQRLEDARPYAERALSVVEDATAAPEVIAEKRFLYARTLWSDPRQRVEAHAQARRARDELVDTGLDSAASLIAQMEQWLAEHPAPTDAVGDD